MVERYIELAKIDTASGECLIRPIVSLKKGEKLHEKGCLSFMRLRVLVRSESAKDDYVKDS